MLRTNGAYKKAVKKVISNIHEDLKFDKMNWEVVWILRGDPNAPYDELGPPIPPSPREKTWAQSKSNKPP